MQDLWAHTCSAGRGYSGAPISLRSHRAVDFDVWPVEISPSPNICIHHLISYFPWRAQSIQPGQLKPKMGDSPKMDVGKHQWYHFGVGEFTTDFRTYFSGWIESDVHWGYDLDVEPWPSSPLPLGFGRRSVPQPPAMVSWRMPPSAAAGTPGAGLKPPPKASFPEEPGGFGECGGRGVGGGGWGEGGGFGHGTSITYADRSLVGSQRPSVWHCVTYLEMPTSKSGEAWRTFYKTMTDGRQ